MAVLNTPATAYRPKLPFGASRSNHAGACTMAEHGQATHEHDTSGRQAQPNPKWPERPTPTPIMCHSRRNGGFGPMDQADVMLIHSTPST